MVLRQRENKMASEQPLKKKLRRGDNTNSTDETDFIHNITEHGVRTLHLTNLPPNLNEDDITALNTINQQYSNEKILYRTSELSDSELKCDKIKEIHDDGEKQDNSSPSSTTSMHCENISIQPAPDILISTNCQQQHYKETDSDHNDDIDQDEMIIETTPPNDDYDCSIFQSYLVRQCLCQISDSALRKPFEGHQIIDNNGISRIAMLCEWSQTKILRFLSNLQILFDIYLKQNNNGYICSRIVNICNTFVHNEHNLIEQIISLCELRDKYINYMATKVISSFLIIAKTNINNEWLEAIVNFLTIENIDFIKMNFALEIIKRVVEWKNVEIHILEEPTIQSPDIAGTSSSSSTSNTSNNVNNNGNNENVDCITVPYSDAESYDTSSIKGLIIKSLESKWPELINKIQYLIINNNTVEAQTCILTFLSLWESTISVKANLSVIDTKPFYAHLENFVNMLNSNLPPIIWKQLLSLFNEVLCYGSTLALQDMLPEDTCQLAHLIVRYVKDYRLLDSLPYRRNENLTVNSFVGTIPLINSTIQQTSIDKTLLQKMTLLVLKSVAIIIKETRSDSSDSSIGSDDYDFSQDMQLIARSIKDVLKKVDTFIKTSLEFLPETQFSKILIHLFNDQDDYMIEAMVCTLDITAGISYQNALAPDFIAMLNPVHSFIEFLRIVGHEFDVLLDYLVSNETCFLLYLLRFLKYTRRYWDRFVSSCYEGGISRTNELDNTMTVLIRLKIQIERLVSKDLFPYNINPVLRLLEICESKYEGNEYS